LFKRTNKSNTKTDKIKHLKRLKRLAPKVPDYTCPDIDFMMERVEKSYKVERPISKLSLRVLERKLERLRQQNESLRESGRYWYKRFKDYFLYPDKK